MTAAVVAMRDVDVKGTKVDLKKLGLLDRQVSEMFDDLVDGDEVALVPLLDVARRTVPFGKDQRAVGCDHGLDRMESVVALISGSCVSDGMLSTVVH